MAYNNWNTSGGSPEDDQVNWPDFTTNDDCLTSFSFDHYQHPLPDMMPNDHTISPLASTTLYSQQRVSPNGAQQGRPSFGQQGNPSFDVYHPQNANGRSGSFGEDNTRPRLRQSQSLYSIPYTNGYPQLSKGNVNLNITQHMSMLEPIETSPTDSTATDFGAMLPPPSNSNTKRTRDGNDTLSACWTSPLCPNGSLDGKPPDPSACGSGCGPFLFSPLSGDIVTGVGNTHARNEIQIEDDSRSAPQEQVTSLSSADEPPVPAPSKSNPLKRSSKRRSRDSLDETTSIGRDLPDVTAASKSVPTPSPPSTVKDESGTPPESTTSHASPPPTTTNPTAPKPRRRLPHNQVERKYRESLNSQLESLRRVIPSLRERPPVDPANPSTFPCDPSNADIEDLPSLTNSKPSKAQILSSATHHIKVLTKDKTGLTEENERLKAKIAQLEKLVRCQDCEVMRFAGQMGAMNMLGGR